MLPRCSGCRLDLYSRWPDGKHFCLSVERISGEVDQHVDAVGADPLRESHVPPASRFNKVVTSASDRRTRLRAIVALASIAPYLDASTVVQAVLAPHTARSGGRIVEP